MDESVRSRVIELLERSLIRDEEFRAARAAARTSLAASVGLAMVRCPACGLLLREDGLAEHARSYGGAAHGEVEAMAEVMSS